MPQLAEERHGLQPAKGLLDQLPFAMTAPIPGMPRRAPIDRAAAIAEFILGHVRRDAHAADGRDPRPDVVGLVGGDGEPPRRQGQLAQQGNRGIALSRPLASVTAVSMMKPWRFSVSRCPRYASFASRLFPLR